MMTKKRKKLWRRIRVHLRCVIFLKTKSKNELTNTLEFSTKGHLGRGKAVKPASPGHCRAPHLEFTNSKRV